MKGGDNFNNVKAKFVTYKGYKVSKSLWSCKKLEISCVSMGHDIFFSVELKSFQETSVKHDRNVYIMATIRSTQLANLRIYILALYSGINSLFYFYESLRLSL